MDTQPTLSLTDRLQVVAAIWAQQNEAPFGRLGRLAINDGGFFGRIEDGTANPTLATLEKFARFLADPANWPEGEVPDEARAFAHVTGVNIAQVSPATGLSGDLSAERDAA